MSTYGNSIIVQEIISAQTQNAVRLVGSQFIRPVALNANWKVIRIGIRVLFTQLLTGLADSQVYGPPDFAIGLCHGSTNGYGDRTTTHFLGSSTGQSSNWVSEPAEVLYDFIDVNGGTRIGTTFANGGNISGAQSQFGQGTAAPWVPTPQMFFLDITKGNPNYSVAAWYISNGQTAGLETRADFLSYITQVSPSKTGHTYSAVPALLPVNEALNGVFDSVNISWNRVDFFPEICDLSIVTLS